MRKAKSNNNKNLLCICSSSLSASKEEIKLNTLLDSKFGILKKDFSEILRPNYINKSFNLLQITYLHCNLAGKCPREFIKFHSLEDIYQEHGFTLCKELTKSLLLEISIFLYLYLNKLSIISGDIKFAIFYNNSSEKNRLLLENYFSNNSIIFLHKGNIRKVRRFANYFDIFAIFNEDDDIIFEDEDKFFNHNSLIKS
jgi:hypothetical protein